MRAHDSDQGYESNLRPKASRLEEEPESALAMRAALSGRLDAAGPRGVMGLQRAVGNAAAATLIEEERSPVHDVIGSGGAPLPADVREDMEGRFGQDFGDVRVHNDGAAHESAKSVNAQAYTVGSNIVFQRDKYDPASDAGKHMLAHELTHVVQQRSGPVDGSDAGGGVKISDPSDRFERDAVANADQLMSAPAPPPAPSHDAQRSADGEDLSLQRQDAPAEEEEATAQTYVQRAEAPGGPLPPPRERLVGSFEADEHSRTIAVVEVIGHASPRWRAARSPEYADVLNLHLAEKRALAVELAVEQILSDMVPGDVVFEPIVSTRTDEPDPLTEPAGVTIGHESRGSAETLKEAGPAGRRAHEPAMLRVEVRVTLRSATETLIDEDIERTEAEWGATRDWGIAVIGETGIEAGIKVGGVLILLKNNETGEVGTYGGVVGGGGLGLGVSFAKAQLPDFASMVTPEWMFFDDFNGAVFTIESSGFGLGAFGWEAQTFWFRSFRKEEETPDPVDIGGFTFGGVELNLRSVESGVMKLMDHPSEQVTKKTRFTSRRSEVARGKGTTGHNVFFTTDSAVISPEQDKELRKYLAGEASKLL